MPATPLAQLIPHPSDTVTPDPPVTSLALVGRIVVGGTWVNTVGYAFAIVGGDAGVADYLVGTRDVIVDAMRGAIADAGLDLEGTSGVRLAIDLDVVSSFDNEPATAGEDGVPGDGPEDADDDVVGEFTIGDLSAVTTIRLEVDEDPANEFRAASATVDDPAGRLAFGRLITAASDAARNALVAHLEDAMPDSADDDLAEAPGFPAGVTAAKVRAALGKGIGVRVVEAELARGITP